MLFFCSSAGGKAGIKKSVGAQIGNMYCITEHNFALMLSLVEGDIYFSHSPSHVLSDSLLYYVYSLLPIDCEVCMCRDFV